MTNYINTPPTDSYSPIIPTYTQNQLNDHNLNNIYQFQPYNDTNRYIFLEVGIMETANHIVINDFIYNSTQYVILSCIYNKLQLSQFNDSCKIPLFKIQSTTSIYSYNFHMFEHKKNNGHITDYTSDANSKILLNGFFTYSLNDTIIARSKKFDGVDAITNLLHYIKES